MYATVSKFKVKSGRQEEARAKATELLETLKGSKGFAGAVICADRETREWIRTTVWETKEDSVAFIGLITPERRKANMGVVDGPFEEKGYDVVGYAAVD
jgi:heme-degrading monooxygenase HmoA